MVMYNDDKTWKQHYDDWVNIKVNFNGSDDVTKHQSEYRLKLITELIKAYEREHKN